MTYLLTYLLTIVVKLLIETRKKLKN